MRDDQRTHLPPVFTFEDFEEAGRAFRPSGTILDRVTDHLVDMLIALDGAQRELWTEETGALMWLEPRVQQLLAKVDCLLQRMTN